MARGRDRPDRTGRRGALPRIGPRRGLRARLRRDADPPGLLGRRPDVARPVRIPAWGRDLALDRTRRRHREPDQRSADRCAGRARRSPGVRARFRHRGAERSRRPARGRHALARGRRHRLGDALAGRPGRRRDLRRRPPRQGLQRRPADDRPARHAGDRSPLPERRRGVRGRLRGPGRGPTDEDRRRVLRLRRPDHRRPGRAGSDSRAAAGVPRFRLEGPRRGRTGGAARGVRPVLPVPGGPLRCSARGLPGRRRWGRHRAADRGRGTRGPSLGCVPATHRDPLPAALDGRRAPGGRVAGLPVVPDRSPGRPRPRPRGPTLEQLPDQGGDERRADLRGDRTTRERRRLVAGTRGLEQPVRGRHDGGRVRGRQPVAVADPRRRAGLPPLLPGRGGGLARGAGLPGEHVRRPGREDPGRAPDDEPRAVLEPLPDQPGPGRPRRAVRRLRRARQPVGHPGRARACPERLLAGRPSGRVGAADPAGSRRAVG